jgi:hypothetical protein
VAGFVAVCLPACIVVSAVCQVLLAWWNRNQTNLESCAAGPAFMCPPACLPCPQVKSKMSDAFSINWLPPLGATGAGH